MKKYILIVLFFSPFAFCESFCDDINNSNQVYLCSKEKKNVADSKLNEQYELLISKIKSVYSSHGDLRDTYLNKVKVSQRVWIKFRDSNCEVYAFQIDKVSQAYETTINQCVVEMSDKRTEELAKIINSI
ncbi:MULTISPECIES: lysozyme inhibitor LprI family protein [unclassified Serratia (in: enterobacteria)]|uniref:lysozyme inhibitor LprI family protein n=1 Tax=unclassified Serratia (in: enterobacteria) TaxID=2647522 RepID=UPI0030762196